jgi:hypothetical protein
MYAFYCITIDETRVALVHVPQAFVKVYDAILKFYQTSLLFGERPIAWYPTLIV